MRPTKLTSCILALLLLTSPILGGTTALAAFANIDGFWAEDAILSLEEQGLFDVLWTEEFSPSQSIKHEDAFKLLATAFELDSNEESQLKDWLNQLLVAHPEGLTRGEFAAVLANLLGLGEHTEVPQGFYPSFADLNIDYPGFLGIEVLQRLALLPTHMVGRFEPYRLITGAEIIYILDQALKLTEVEGIVAEVENEGRQVVLTSTEEEEQIVLNLLAETLYLNPSSLTREPLTRNEKLNPGQNIVALTRGSQALLVQFDEENPVQVIMQGLNQATQVLADILTPAQVNALISGDWEQLGEEVRYEIYQELVDRGVAPWEADALIQQDWSNLQTMLQERLTQESADYLDVAPELIQAALNQNWSQLLEYAQVELAQRILTSEWLQDVMGN